MGQGVWRMIVVGFERWGWVLVLGWFGYAVVAVVDHDAGQAAVSGFWTAASGYIWRDLRAAKREIVGGRR